MTLRRPNPRGSGDALRVELVAAATELLLSPQVVSAPSLRAVARTCGVSPGAVYLHFSSRADLVTAVIEAQFDRLRQALHASVDPQSAARDRLHALADAYVTWGLANPGAYQLLFESADLLETAADGTVDESVVDEAEPSSPLEPHQGPGADLLVAVATVLAQLGAPATSVPALTERTWAVLHGLVSLRLHKPGSPWAGDLAVDVRALVDAVTATH